MEILTINYEYPPVGGGGGVAARNLAEEFVHCGHQVDYVTSQFKGLKRNEEINGVQIYRENIWGRADLYTATIVSMLLYPLVGIKRSLELSRNKRYDIIHTHFAIPSGPAGYIISKYLRIPNVLSIHGGDIYDPSKKNSPHNNLILKFAVKRILNQADIIIPQSCDTHKRAKELYNPKTAFERIPLGFVCKKFTTISRQELGLKKGKVYAISVSRLIPRKAYPDLLKAFKIASIENMELIILGSGPEDSMLKKQAVEMKIRDRVHFVGFVDEILKYQYLSVSDFFVLATLHEGYGIVYQEAMYCGLPIVTTNVGGQTDFLIEGENGLLSEPGNCEALAKSMRRLVLDPDLRKKISNKNHDDIKAHFVENIAKQYLEIFKAVQRKKR